MDPTLLAQMDGGKARATVQLLLRLFPYPVGYCSKINYLYLNQGVWDGQQVIPVDWVHVSVQPHTETGGPRDYGYRWWYNPVLNVYSAQG